MLQKEPILVNGTRILGPFESDLLRESIEKDYLRTIYDVCLWTGMRYIEVQRFYSHPEWWMSLRKCVHLPAEAQKKVKRTQIERYVHPIPAQLETILPYFHKNTKPPSLQAWNQNLARWSVKSGLNSIGLSAKSTRKSIESWMICAGIPLHVVCLRQGHDSLTSMQHYQGLPFAEDELTEIRRRLAGITIAIV